MHRGALLTLPNILSLSRLALVPAFVLVPTPAARAAIVVAAGLTDLLDGWLARRRRAATRVGAILDPIADRLFVLGALVVLLLEGALSVWQGLLLLTRDVATTIGFFVARASSDLLAPALVGPLAVATCVASIVAIADYTLMLRRGRAA